jgi:hypothetical protein
MSGGPRGAMDESTQRPVASTQRRLSPGKLHALQRCACTPGHESSASSSHASPHVRVRSLAGTRVCASDAPVTRVTLLRLCRSLDGGAAVGWPLCRFTGAGFPLRETRETETAGVWVITFRVRSVVSGDVEPSVPGACGAGGWCRAARHPYRVRAICTQRPQGRRTGAAGARPGHHRPPGREPVRRRPPRREPARSPPRPGRPQRGRSARRRPDRGRSARRRSARRGPHRRRCSSPGPR